MPPEVTVQDTEKPDAAAVAELAKVETEKTEETKTTEGAEVKTDAQTDEEKAADATQAAKVLSKHKQTASERVQQAVTRQRDAERTTDRLQRRVNELEAKLAAPPDPNKYDDNAQYTADLTAHTLDKREVTRVKDDLKEATDEKYQAIAEGWNTRVADFTEQAPDFAEVVYGPNTLPISKDTSMTIAEMEDGPQVAYFLAKNAAEARRIDRLPERAKAIELGKLAGKLSAPALKKITQAPAPVKQVAGRSELTPPNDPSKMSFKEFKSYREGGGKPS